jgi:hypothetical protein
MSKSAACESRGTCEPIRFWEFRDGGPRLRPRVPGKRVAVVETQRTVGGACLRWATFPAKPSAKLSLPLLRPLRPGARRLADGGASDRRTTPGARDGGRPTRVRGRYREEIDRDEIADVVGEECSPRLRGWRASLRDQPGQRCARLSRSRVSGARHGFGAHPTADSRRPFCGRGRR